MSLSAPEPLQAQHLLEGFDSGEPSLNDWLKRRARANQASGASRTFVVSEGDRVVGYYALASGAITLESATGRFRRNMPNSIPVAVLARLAVDRVWQGKGLGQALFRDAAARVVHASDVIGIRGIIVHAISHEAKNFYLAIGFSESPADPMTLMVTVADVQAAFDEE